MVRIGPEGAHHEINSKRMFWTYKVNTIFRDKQGAIQKVVYKNNLKALSNCAKFSKSSYKIEVILTGVS